MDDLGDRRERRIVEAGARQQHLEGAAVALVRDTRPRTCRSAARPRAARSCAAGTNLKRASGSMKRRISQAEAMRSTCTRSRVTQTLAHERRRPARQALLPGSWRRSFPAIGVSSPAIRPFGRVARRRRRRSRWRHDLRSAAGAGAPRGSPPRPRRGSAVEPALEHASARASVGEPGVVLVARGDEHAARAARSSSPRAASPRRPAPRRRRSTISRASQAKSSCVSLVARQRIDRVLHRHRAQRLQPAPHLDPRIGRLGRQLVDQQQPRPSWSARRRRAWFTCTTRRTVFATHVSLFLANTVSQRHNRD